MFLEEELVLKVGMDEENFRSEDHRGVIVKLDLTVPKDKGSIHD